MLGLMPHPEHAVDPLLGPTGGVAVLQGLLPTRREQWPLRSEAGRQTARRVIGTRVTSRFELGPGLLGLIDLRPPVVIGTG